MERTTPLAGQEDREMGRRSRLLGLSGILVASLAMVLLGMFGARSPELVLSRGPAMVASPGEVDEGQAFTVSGSGLARDHVYSLAFSLDDGTQLMDPVRVKTTHGGSFRWTGSTYLFIVPAFVTDPGTDWFFTVSLLDGYTTVATTP